MYIVAEDRTARVLVKLAGQVTPDPLTGQLLATFKNTPQLPFEDLSLHFFGGSRAPLGTPPLCGGYTTTASIAPWSGNAAVASSSEFQITSGPNGAPCQSLAFKPTFKVTTTAKTSRAAGASLTIPGALGSESNITRVKIDLVGSTFISKKGITSSTFKTAPDQPVTSFELTLPQGKYSALAANGNLCKSKLVMPTAFVAQNGAVIHQSTKITATGCPKSKKATKKKHGKRKRKK